MAQAVRICLLTAVVYGIVAATVVYGITPAMHRAGYLLLRDNNTIESYQKRAIGSAALGYPLLCIVLILGARYRGQPAAMPERPRPQSSDVS